MEQLLSGFIGALIATILSVLYLFISDHKRIRTQLSLEVVSHFDEIYRRLQTLHTEKNSEYTGRQKGLVNGEYSTISRRLKDLLNTNQVGVKLAIVYGEGDLTAAYNQLSALCLEATFLIWESNAENWTKKRREILALFKDKIDPLRRSFERTLIQGTRTKQIIKDFLKNLLSKRKNNA